MQDPKQWNLRKDFTMSNLSMQAVYSRKDNLLQHLKKFHSENIAARMPMKKVQKSKSCLAESMVFNTPSTMIVSGATMFGKTEWVKRLLAHEGNMMIPVPKKVLFYTSTGNNLILKC